MKIWSVVQRLDFGATYHVECTDDGHKTVVQGSNFPSYASADRARKKAVRFLARALRLKKEER